MVASTPDTTVVLRLPLSASRRRVWWVSGLTVLLALVGLISCWLTPEIAAPLRPGLDFTGGTQIQLESDCGESCRDLKSIAVSSPVWSLTLPVEDDEPAPNLRSARVQLLDGGESLVLRVPTLTAAQGQALIAAVEPIAGPFVSGGQSVDTIGPSLGRQLLRSTLISLVVAFSGIALYISFRYDGRYAFLALVALALALTLRLDGGTTLDAVMRVLYDRFGETGKGVPENGIQAVVAELTELDVTEFFEEALHGTGDALWSRLSALLERAGIEATLRPREGTKDRGGKPGKKRIK